MFKKGQNTRQRGTGRTDAYFKKIIDSVTATDAQKLKAAIMLSVMKLEREGKAALALAMLTGKVLADAPDLAEKPVPQDSPEPTVVPKVDSF
jgi:hypothetical protein